MKTHLLFLLSLISCAYSAQNLTITRAAYEPVIGDISRRYTLDTTNYTSGMPNTAGNGVTWDFSNLSVTPVLAVSNYVDPSTLTVTVPTGATFAESQNGSNNFYKSTTTPTTQTEILSIKAGTLALNFTNSGIIARYPINYGYSLSDAIAGTVDFSVAANFSGNVTTTADGQGTLLMPQSNTYSNVLRVKSVQTITITVFSIIKIADIKQINYSYYHASSKFPILTVNQSITTFSSQTTEVSSATGNADFLVIGVNENELNSNFFMVYPNPAENSVTVKLSDAMVPESMSVIDVLGKKVLTAKNTNSIDVSNLPRGSYFIEVKSKNHFGRKSLILTK